MKRTIQTIEGHKSDAKVGVLRFADAPEVKVRYWLNWAFVELLKEGATAECETEEKPSKYGDETWIKSWDGVGQKARRAGVFAPAPQDKASIALQAAAQISAAVIAAGFPESLDTTLDVADRFYAWLHNPGAPRPKANLPAQMPTSRAGLEERKEASILKDLDRPSFQGSTSGQACKAELPRESFFRLCKELGLPEHAGEYRLYNHAVVGRVLGRALMSLADLTEDEWTRVAAWAQSVKDGKVKFPSTWILMMKRAAEPIDSSDLVAGLSDMAARKVV